MSTPVTAPAVMLAPSLPTVLQAPAPVENIMLALGQRIALLCDSGIQVVGTLVGLTPDPRTMPVDPYAAPGVGAPLYRFDLLKMRDVEILAVGGVLLEKHPSDFTFVNRSVCRPYLLPADAAPGEVAEPVVALARAETYASVLVASVLPRSAVSEEAEITEEVPAETPSEQADDAMEDLNEIADELEDNDYTTEASDVRDVAPGLESDSDAFFGDEEDEPWFFSDHAPSEGTLIRREIEMSPELLAPKQVAPMPSEMAAPPVMVVQEPLQETAPRGDSPAAGTLYSGWDSSRDKLQMLLGEDVSAARPTTLPEAAQESNAGDPQMLAKAILQCLPSAEQIRALSTTGMAPVLYGYGQCVSRLRELLGDHPEIAAVLAEMSDLLDARGNDASAVMRLQPEPSLLNLSLMTPDGGL